MKSAKRFHPYLSEFVRITTDKRHEKSLEGKQASRENEQHFQDANVAEVNMVKRLLLNLRIPIIFDAPTVANEVWKTCKYKIGILIMPYHQ